MFTFISDNIGTIVVAVIIFGITFAIALKMAFDKKHGKNITCDCANCPNSTQLCAKRTNSKKQDS